MGCIDEQNIPIIITIQILFKNVKYTKGKSKVVLWGQESPRWESTTTDCGVN